MPGMKLQAFKGMYPKISPEHIPDGGATLARNVKLYSGNLLPYKEPKQIQSIPTGTKTIYKNEAGVWQTNANDLDIVNITTGGDSPLRTYTTGDGAPKVDDVIPLGLPIPKETPTATVHDPIYQQIDGIFRGEIGVAGALLTSKAAADLFSEGDIITIHGFEGEQASFNTENGVVDHTNDRYVFYHNIGPPVALAPDVPDSAHIYIQGQPTPRQYVFTWVTGYGEESLPSEPFPADLRVVEGYTVTLSGLPTASPTGRDDIKGIRIYRLVTSATGSSYLRTNTLWFGTTAPSQLNEKDSGTPEFIAPTGIFTEGKNVNNLTIALPSQDWDAPHPRMIGLKEVHNNILVGFFDRELCFSFPNIPHAWPERYRLSLPYNIVAVEATQGSILVLTDTYAYVVSGNDPSTMTAVRLNTPYGCLSKRSVVVLDNGVMWATNAGLALYQAGGGLVLATQASIDWDEWSGMYDLDTLRAWYYEGKYLASDDNPAHKSFVFYPGQNEGYFVELDQKFDACYYDRMTGEMFFAEGGNLSQWDAPNDPDATPPYVATNLVGTWCSQYYISPEPKNYGAIKPEFYPFDEPQLLPAGLPPNRGNKKEWWGLMFCLSRPYKDPIKTQCYIIENPGKVKLLKSGFKDDTYQICIYTQVEVRSCVAAETPLEVRIVP